jgi:hypothetical protein
MPRGGKKAKRTKHSAGGRLGGKARFIEGTCAACEIRRGEAHNQVCVGFFMRWRSDHRASLQGQLHVLLHSSYSGKWSKSPRALGAIATRL